MGKRIYLLGVVFALLLATPGCMESQAPQASINAVKVMPKNYVGRSVTLSGRVLELVEAQPGSTEGVYILIDDSDTEGIPIKTFKLPGTGQMLCVQGVVDYDADAEYDQGKVFIKEQNKKEAAIKNGRISCGVDPMIYILIGVGAVLVIGAIVLVIILLKPSQPQQAVQQPPAGERACLKCGAMYSVQFPNCPQCGTPAGQQAAAPAPPPARPASEGATRIDIGARGGGRGAGETQIISTARALLVGKSGQDRSSKFDINRDKMKIGRGKAGNDIALTDPSVSRDHAVIKIENGRFFITDIGSSNGTFVNGQRVEGRQELNDNDEVGLGETTMKFTRID